MALLEDLLGWIGSTQCMGGEEGNTGRFLDRTSVAAADADADADATATRTRAGALRESASSQVYIRMGRVGTWAMGHGWIQPVMGHTGLTSHGALGKPICLLPPQMVGEFKKKSSSCLSQLWAQSTFLS